MTDETTGWDEPRLRAMMLDVMDAEKSRFADAVADKLFERMALHLELLGFGSQDAHEREALRRDMDFVRTLRRSANAGVAKMVAVMLGLALAGVGTLAALGAGVKISFGK